MEKYFKMSSAKIFTRNVKRYISTETTDMGDIMTIVIKLHRRS